MQYDVDFININHLFAIHFHRLNIALLRDMENFHVNLSWHVVVIHIAGIGVPMQQ